MAKPIHEHLCSIHATARLQFIVESSCETNDTFDMGKDSKRSENRSKTGGKLQKVSLLFRFFIFNPPTVTISIAISFHKRFQNLNASCLRNFYPFITQDHKDSFFVFIHQCAPFISNSASSYILRSSFFVVVYVVFYPPKFITRDSKSIC